MPKKTFETDEQAYNAVYNYYLEYSRSEHKFPKTNEVEKNLKIHFRSYGIDQKEIKLKVLKQRMDEDFFNRGKDPTLKELNSEFGVGTSRYIKDLEFPTWSAFRYSRIGKETRRKFATKEKALSALRSKVKELIEKGKYEGMDDAQKKVGTNIATYGIKWREEVLYPVYDKIIIEELEKNPKIGYRGFRQKYPFAQIFLKNQGGLVIFKVKNKIPITQIEENMLLRRLILQKVKPKPEPPTAEEDIWEFIKKKTGKSYNTFKIPQEIEYLKHRKKIEGGKIYGGYWEVE